MLGFVTAQSAFFVGVSIPQVFLLPEVCPGNDKPAVLVRFIVWSVKYTLLTKDITFSMLI